MKLTVRLQTLGCYHSPCRTCSSLRLDKLNPKLTWYCNITGAGVKDIRRNRLFNIIKLF